MNKIAGFILILAIVLFSGISVDAQEKKVTGFRGDILQDLQDLEKKFTSLAEAMGEDQYSWRPGKGVRSVSEANMHVAATTYWFLNILGEKIPEGLNLTNDYKSTFEFEKIAEKEKVVSILKDSFKYFKALVEKTSDANLTKPREFFGQQSSLQSAFLMMVTHCHEHLGQLIAYARVNGVVPPWSK